MPVQRSLNNKEDNAVKLMHYLEQLVDKKALFGTLQMKEEAIGAMIRLGVATPLKVERSPTGVHKVRFLLPELYRYVHFTAVRAGLDVQIDGSIVTSDNLTLTFDYNH